jgi:methylated-DNA-[protein]-cysteine S-methyltransferase
MKASIRSIHGTCESPFGDLLLLSDGEVLTGLYLPPHSGGRPHAPEPGSTRDQAAFATVREQLRAYFAGELRDFDVDYRCDGTEFQRQSWEELTRIPYGVTISYQEQARRIGRPTATRAVGAANGRNPISIIVPCHRVVGANGSLTGYGGGLDRKQWLLEHEAFSRGHAAEKTRFRRDSRADLATLG